MNSKGICVLTSGGLDSAVLLSLMSQRFKRVFPLYIRCGLVWEKAELYWLRRFLAKARLPRLGPLNTLSLSVKELYQAHWSLTARRVPGRLSKDEAVYLPGRNLLLLSQAALFCKLKGLNRLALGPLKGNPFPDSQPAFFRAFEKLVRVGLGHSLKILTPFSRMGKREVLKRGAGLPLELTFSCLHPRGIRSCARCNKCAEREKVFQDVL